MPEYNTKSLNPKAKYLQQLMTHVFQIANSKIPIRKISFNFLRKKTDPIFNKKGEILYNDNILIEILNNITNIMKEKDLSFMSAKHIGQNKNIICIKQDETYKFYADLEIVQYSTEFAPLSIKIEPLGPKFFAKFMPVYTPEIPQLSYYKGFEIIVTPSNNRLDERKLKYQKYDETSTFPETQNDISMAAHYSEIVLNSENFNKYYHNLQFWQKILLNIYSSYQYVSTVIVEKTSYLTRLITKNSLKSVQQQPVKSEEISILSSQNSQNSSVNLDSQQKKGDHNIS